MDRPELLRGRIAAVVNSGSGGAGAASADRMRAIFADHGFPDATVISAAPRKVRQSLLKATEAGDVICVLGGDGTLRTAAGICGPANKPLIALPGGTMNMLPHALYGEVEWEAALTATLADPRVRTVSGGRAGRYSFFCAAVAGAPSLWADAREAVRGGHPVEAAKRSITAIRRSDEALQYQFDDGAQGKAEAVVVMCPLVSKALKADDAFLEAAAVEPVTAVGLFSLAFHAVFADWREDPAVAVSQVKRISLVGHGRIPVILDGERVSFGRRVTISYRANAFRALVGAGPTA